MVVTVIDPGKLVKVGPDKLDAKDILEFAEVLIEEHGWNRSAPADHPDTKIVNTPAGGFTLHGAIGEAARRAVTEPSSRDAYRAKDYSTGSTLKPGARELRDDANQLLIDAHGKGDYDINDAAQTADEVLAASRQARGAEPVAQT